MAKAYTRAPKRRLQDMLNTPRWSAARQNNTRGMGLARDVRAGQALPMPRKWGRRVTGRR